MKLTRPSTNPALPSIPDEDELAVRMREAEALRVEYRRVTGRINFRRRRARMFVTLLVLTLAGALATAVFLLSPTDWQISQQSRFTQMTALIFLALAATPLAAYFARRYDRQRERARIASMRQREILHRLGQLDNETGVRRRRHRRRRRTWTWRIEYPSKFARPPLESMAIAELEEAAATLGNSLTEERGLRDVAYLHAGVTAAITMGVAFTLTLTGPEYLNDFLGGKRWGGAVGPDPLVFWLGLTALLIVLGGGGSHRVSVLLRRARKYKDRMMAVERALWDARVLLRERREEV